MKVKLAILAIALFVIGAALGGVALVTRKGSSPNTSIAKSFDRTHPTTPITIMRCVSLASAGMNGVYECAGVLAGTSNATCEVVLATTNVIGNKGAGVIAAQSDPAACVFA